MTTTQNTAPATSVVVGNSKTIHLAHGTQVSDTRLATDALLCGTAPIARSWEATTSTTTGLRIVRWTPTCKKCVAASLH